MHGEGPPILISTRWLSPLQHDWASPVWRHFLEDIGRFATIIRFDERGHGLSDWDVTDFSLQARIGDLTAVADDAGFDTFALMAMAQGGPVAISYAHRNPERVTRLVFYDSYADPQHGITDDDLEPEDAFEQRSTRPRRVRSNSSTGRCGRSATTTRSPPRSSAASAR